MKRDSKKMHTHMPMNIALLICSFFCFSLNGYSQNGKVIIKPLQDQSGYHVSYADDIKNSGDLMYIALRSVGTDNYDLILTLYNPEFPSNLDGESVNINLVLSNGDVLAGKSVGIVSDVPGFMGLMTSVRFYFFWNVKNGKYVATNFRGGNPNNKEILPAAQYLKLLTSYNIEKVGVSSSGKKLFMLDVAEETQGILREMCQVLGKQIGKHDFYTTASQTESRQPITQTGNQYPIQMSVKQMADRPLGILPWNIAKKDIKQTLKNKTSWEFQFRYDGFYIETADHFYKAPYYLTYKNMHGHAQMIISDVNQEVRQVSYYFSTPTREEALDIASAMLTEIRALGVKMIDIEDKDFVLRTFSGKKATGETYNGVFYNHKCYSLEVQKRGEQYEIEFEIKYVPTL